MGNCMGLLSKNKFRVIATIVIALMVYLYLNEPKHKPKVKIEKTWESLATNCGYEPYLENSYRSNYLFN
jgi:hypothetical protein